MMQKSIEREKKNQWSNQQNLLLKELYPNYSSKKWKIISQKFRQKGLNRTQSEIRQRWTNFQDPVILFTSWKEQQMQTLYKSYARFGSKWSFIKKTLPGRTENKIKNKFYGNIRIFIRFVISYFNSSKQDTMWIHKINPQILKDTYKGSQQFSDFKNEMEEAIEQMGYKVDKIKLLTRIEMNQAIYKFFYDKIMLFNTESEENSTERRKRENSEQNQLDHHKKFEENEQFMASEILKKEQNQVEQNISLYHNSPGLISNNPNLEFTAQNIILPLDPSTYPLMYMQNYLPCYNQWFYHQ